MVTLVMCTHRMWNEKTSKYSYTKDTIWLSRMFFKEKVEDYKEESNSHGKVRVNPNHASKERREDNGSNNFQTALLSWMAKPKTKDGYGTQCVHAP